LAIRNGPNIEAVLNLFLQSDVRVWREKDGWTGPFKFIATDGDICIIDMLYGPTNFRSTVVKLYYIFTEIPQGKKIENTEFFDEDRNELADQVYFFKNDVEKRPIEID